MPVFWVIIITVKDAPRYAADRRILWDLSIERA